MTIKRFWIFETFAGVLVFIGGLIATIALVAETGERVPDSECSSAMRAAVLAVCYTSSDPKVLLGVVPLLLGAAMVGVGIWRWIAAASNEGDSGGGGGLFGSLKALQEQAMSQMQGGSALSVGGEPPTPPSAPPPESPPASP